MAASVVDLVGFYKRQSFKISRELSSFRGAGCDPAKFPCAEYHIVLEGYSVSLYN